MIEILLNDKLFILFFQWSLFFVVAIICKPLLYTIRGVWFATEIENCSNFLPLFLCLSLGGALGRTIDIAANAQYVFFIIFLILGFLFGIYNSLKNFRI